MRILQLNTVDEGGGAAAVCLHLLSGYRSNGCDARLVVGRKSSANPHVSTLPEDAGLWWRASGYNALQCRLGERARRSPGRGWGRLSRSLRLATHPRALLDVYAGREDFNFPGSTQLFDADGELPDIVHVHNLHGGYFDLRALASISGRVPTVVTLHDEWLLTGHCGHPFECDRWTTGCGSCPDLNIEPAVRRDATAANWQRKRSIYASSRLYVASPSRWLLARAERSVMGPAIAETRVIPNGVDCSVFTQADQRTARERLGLSHDAFVILVVTGPPGNRWRDQTMLAAVLAQVRQTVHLREVVQVVAVGGERPEAVGVRYDGYRAGGHQMAAYYQAADIYLHLAKADTFPNTVIESLACGTPVIATDVGGIAEQVVTADLGVLRPGAVVPPQTTGIVIRAGDSRATFDAIAALHANRRALAAMGAAAHEDARVRFDLNRQVECYLSWFRAIIDGRTHHAVPAG